MGRAADRQPSSLSGSYFLSLFFFGMKSQALGRSPGQPPAQHAMQGEDNTDVGWVVQDWPAKELIVPLATSNMQP